MRFLNIYKCKESRPPTQEKMDRMGKLSSRFAG
jgi:hypothetical protein